jgi:hypothetical protein
MGADSLGDGGLNARSLGILHLMPVGLLTSPGGMETEMWLLWPQGDGPPRCAGISQVTWAHLAITL